jgi:hypothetical protein
VLACYLVLALWVQAHLLVDIDHRVSAPLPADHIWFEWLLEHGAYSVRHGLNPLFSTRQNVPLGVNMMANTSMLGGTIPLAPLTLWLGPQVSYAVLLVVGLAGTAASTYWVMSRHLVSARLGAALAGGFVGFAPGFVHHANGQPNFTLNVMVPFILLAMFRLARSRRFLRDGAALGLLVTYQVFLNEEVLLIIVAGGAVALAIYLGQRRDGARRMLSGLLRGGAVAVVLAGVLLAYPLWFQFCGPQAYHSGFPWSSWGEDLTGFVTFSKYSLGNATALWEPPIGIKEQTTWFGWPLFLTAVLSAVVLWRRRDVLARTAILTSAIFGLLSLGPEVSFNAGPTGVAGPWALVGQHAPLLRMMVPTRLAIVVVGAVGVLLALMWDELSAAVRAAGPTHGLVTAWAYAAFGIALATVLPMPLPASGLPPVPRFITSGDWRAYVPGGRTLVPVPLPDRFGGLATLRWSVAAGQEFPIPAGYFLGPDERGAVILGSPARPTTMLVDQVAGSGIVPAVTGQMRRDARDDLRYWRASVVVLGSYPHEQELIAVLDRLLGPGRYVDDVWLWPIG